MNVDDVITVGLSIIASLGGGSLIVFALSSWLGKVWAGRILEGERSKISQELEMLKRNNQNHINAIGVSSSLYLDAQKTYAAERIVAIKSLWSDLMDLRDNRPSSITYLDVLEFDEYKQIYKNQKLNFFDEELDFISLVKVIKSDTEKLRPFVDEKAYVYFWAYRALVGRIASYIRRIREEGGPSQSWQFDIGVVEILKTIFDDRQIKKIQDELWMVHALFSHIEALFVEHLRELSSGADSSKKSLDHAMNLNRVAATIKEMEDAESNR